MISKIWKRFCVDLSASQKLNVNFDYNDDDTVESSEEEVLILPSVVRNAIHHLKSNKSPGLDEVPAELIKYAGEWSATVIQRRCKIWKTKHGQLNRKTLPFSLYKRRMMLVSVKTPEQLLLFPISAKSCCTS